MRSLGGFVLLAGIGVALFVVSARARRQRTSLDHVQRVAATRAAELPLTKFTARRAPSSFSPSIALTMPARHGTRNFAKVEPKVAPTPVPTPDPVVSQGRSGWQTVVAVATPAAPAAPQPTTLAPNDPEARYKLVLDIQQQLRRVGCYWGRMDGSWGIATKGAMKEFTDRVNATLPLDEPDYVQLTLIQSHGEKTCGTCPAGQSLSASGRCVGLPITAQAKQPSTPQLASTRRRKCCPGRRRRPRAWRADSRCSDRWRPRSFRPSRCRDAWRSAGRSRPRLTRRARRPQRRAWSLRRQAWRLPHSIRTRPQPSL